MKKISILLGGITLLITACQSKTSPENLLNVAASLPASQLVSDKGLHVITSFINKKEHTMSTLYGNEAALKQLKEGSRSAPGEILSLITWKQKDDPHWFGARIPGKIGSKEDIEVINADQHIRINYQRFNGPLLEKINDTTGNASRIAFILSQQPSVMP